MPELPEVETMVRGIRKATQGATITGLAKCRCLCKPLDIRPGWPTIRRRCASQEITKVYRLAKRVVLQLTTGDSLVIEPRMTGLMLLHDPPNREHLRIQWRLSRRGEQYSLWFWDRRGLGTLRLYTPEEMQTHLGPAKLGHDALDMTAERWESVCQTTSRAIKVALLDQTFVAGIGNIYASEILHHAGISPELPACELDEHQLNRLAVATQTILRQAIEQEGSTLNDGTYRNALNQNGGYQNEHRVYQKHGQTCRSCGEGVIQRTVQAQRATFFCPVCQPRS